MITPIQDGLSPLIREDGTDRFVQVTRSIFLAHSGINADGRVLCNAAQRLAVEHEYTFDEEIPMNVFLEEMSLLMQRYTMKPGSRPFGSSLMVGFIQPSLQNKNGHDQDDRQLFTIDPSGNVLCWDDGIAVIGEDEGILQELETHKDATAENVDEIIGTFTTALRKLRNTAKKEQTFRTKQRNSLDLLVAYLDSQSGLIVMKCSR